MVRITSFFLFIISFMVFSCRSGQEVNTKVIPTVKTDTVRVNTSRMTTTFPGKIRPADEVNLPFRIAGVIKKVNVKPGSFVKKGDIVAEMDPRDYEIQLSATEAEYRQIKGEADRVMGLYEKNSVTQNDYEKAVYGLEQIAAKYNAHKNALKDTKLQAPFDGYVQRVMFDSNEAVNAGMPVVSMISSGIPEVYIHIPASVYMRSNRFDSFYCTLDLYPEAVFPLSFISMTHKANQNQLYEMRFQMHEIQNHGVVITPGMSVTVNIVYKSDGFLETVVPATAVLSTNGQTKVWVLDTKSHTVTSRNVTIKSFLRDGNAVVEKGLTAGEVVVTGGVNAVAEGDEVIVLPPVSKTNMGGML